ncbi:MAG: DUF3836 domain-containing protein [Bacteroides sp.]|nr:DUF3836 domain-containing protein [Bacteroides sp.]
MKANVFFKAVCMIVIMLTSVSVANAQNKYVIEDTKEGEKVMSRTIYINKKGSHYHLKSDFTYDGNNRLATKETFLWNKRKQKWVPQKFLQYTYTHSDLIITSSSWNLYEKAYTENVKQASYDINQPGLQIAQLTYK